MSKDYFAHKSTAYDSNPSRADNVKNIAEGILEAIAYTNDQSIMDFGAGTGLLTAHIAPYVKKITTVDISPSMNEKMREKAPTLPCHIEVLHADLATENLERIFDGIISSMTIHHIEDVQKLFHTLYSLLRSGGSLAIADLEKEDGSFHEEDTGVFHFGFEYDTFLTYAKNAGFVELQMRRVSVAHKPYGAYPIFLLTGIKP